MDCDQPQTSQPRLKKTRIGPPGPLSHGSGASPADREGAGNAWEEEVAVVLPTPCPDTINVRAKKNGPPGPLSHGSGASPADREGAGNAWEEEVAVVLPTPRKPMYARACMRA